ncbi:MAG: bifunctional oligoribonuclease/PAP phosphatase NrnA [Phycisphaerae bacterium]
MVTAADAIPPPADVLAALRRAKRVALVAHVTPDLDCLGCLGAMNLALRALNKTPLVALPAGSVSRRLAFLVELGRITPASIDELRTSDLVVVMDTAKERRVNLDGKLEALLGIPVLNIDHHATNTQFGDARWIDPHRSSTCEMIHDLLRALDIPLTPEIATLLYVGVHGDTRGFSLVNTTPRSLAVAHELAASGAAIANACERLHRSQSRAEFELAKLIYQNTRVSADGRVAWSTASHAQIAATGCGANDVDEQVDIPRSIEGIALAILITEGQPGQVRMNFRAEGNLSVLELAQQFGGGGHHSRAGAVLSGDFETIAARVVAAALSYTIG